MTDAELAAARLTALLDAEREIERLRAQRILDNEDLTHSFDLGLVAGERRERAALVALLRDKANAPHHIEAGERALSPSVRGLLLLAASRIERGEHRREEER